LALKLYDGKDVRNVGIAGHGGSGKTSLVSALLYTAGSVDRLGRVDEGNTVTDFDEEEIARKLTISTGVAYAEWGAPSKVKLNLLDTPGYNTFIGDTRATLIAADSVLVVVDAVAGVEVQTEKVWSFAEEFGQARALVVNRLDRERAGFDRAVESIQNAFGRGAVPVQMPLGEEKNMRGVVDLIAMKAYSYEPGGNGKGKEEPIPANLADAAQAAHEKLVEAAAEGDDALLEEFFDKGTLPVEHIVDGLRTAITNGRMFPILCACGLKNEGSDQILNFLVTFMPSAADRGPLAGRVKGAAKPGGELDVIRKTTNDEPLSVYVYKTVADPFAGRLTYFKVQSGVLKSDATILNYVRSTEERLAHVSVLLGKEQVPVQELRAGDLGVVAKLKDTLTGDTLGAVKGTPIFYPPVVLPEPLIRFAIEAKSRADEDRMGVALHKILEEDPSLRFERDPQTKEFLLGGSGQQHIEVIVSKLKKRYHVEVMLHAPRVPYRETIRGKADVEGKHKKQSGGHGQFGVCSVKMEPLPRGGGFEFVNDIFGGSIPRNFIPAVEKGIVESALRGYLAGFPVVDFRATVYDGKYHDVDSSEMAFKIAGSLAFKAAMAVAKPVLLEPVMNVEVYAPDTYSGDLMGDLNSRRGRIQGMDNKGSMTVIKAQVPMAEMLTYATDLTSKTQGRASYHMEFDHYDTVPGPIADKVIAAAKAAKAGQVEEVEE
jgi:elongation factor G